MAKKKQKPEPIPVYRKCDCWIGKLDEENQMNCYCELETHSSIRYSVRDSKNDVHSRWETLNEAMQDGRKRMDGYFHIYDNLEKKIVVAYGTFERE